MANVILKEEGLQGQSKFTHVLNLTTPQRALFLFSVAGSESSENLDRNLYTERLVPPPMRHDCGLCLPLRGQINSKKIQNLLHVVSGEALASVVSQSS